MKFYLFPCLLLASINCFSGEGSVEFNSKAEQTVLSKLDKAILSLEKKSIGKVKKALCSFQDAQGVHAGSNILNSIDGVGVKGTFDVSKIWPSPFGAKVGVEVVYWFPKNNLGEIEKHIHIIPSASVSSKVTTLKDSLDADLSVIFGCNGDAQKYGGYFTSIHYAGVSLNLGTDWTPLAERHYISRLESNTPGGVNDVDSIDLTKVRGILKNKGYRLRRHLAPLLNSLNQNTENIYEKAYSTKYYSIADIMKVVGLKYYDDNRNRTNMHEVYKRALKASQQLLGPNQDSNEILLKFAELEKLTIQKNENPRNYVTLRLPTNRLKFDKIIHDFYGDSEDIKETDLTKPIGIHQQMYALSGHFFGKNYNNKIFKIAFNTLAKPTDGPYLYSVTGSTHLDIKKKMLNNVAYNCKKQRTHYPLTRWFRAYANNQATYVDCFGFGKNEVYRKNVSQRIYTSGQFKKIQRELRKIKSFFEDFEAMRYATRHGFIQLSDSFHTVKDVYSFSTGGIAKPKYTDAFTGCNSVGIDVHGLKNAASLSLATLKDGFQGLRSRVATGVSIGKALTSIMGHSHITGEISHYYHTPYHQHFPASEGLPFIRSLRALKDLDCSEDGVSSLDEKTH